MFRGCGSESKIPCDAVLIPGYRDVNRLTAEEKNEDQEGDTKEEEEEIEAASAEAETAVAASKRAMISENDESCKFASKLRTRA